MWMHTLETTFKSGSNFEGMGKRLISLLFVLLTVPTPKKDNLLRFTFLMLIYLLRISACMSIQCLGGRLASLLCREILPLASVLLTTTRSFPRVGLRKGRMANRTRTNISSSSVSASYGFTRPHYHLCHSLNVIDGKASRTCVCLCGGDLRRQLTAPSPSAESSRLSADCADWEQLVLPSSTCDVNRKAGTDRMFLSVSWNNSAHCSNSGCGGVRVEKRLYGGCKRKTPHTWDFHGIPKM